jgi:hypothetical protein
MIDPSDETLGRSGGGGGGGGGGTITAGVIVITNEAGAAPGACTLIVYFPGIA